MVALAALLAAASAAPSGPARVVVFWNTSLRINGAPSFDRSKYFNVHSQPGSANWDADEIAQFQTEYGASLGRSFVFSATMASVRESPTRPGFVDPQSLEAWCSSNHLKLDGWSMGSVDLIHSSKTAQLYPKGCGGGPPKGFVPGSHNATADFFVRFFEACMMPTSRSRYLIEVENECNVKTGTCNTTFEEMIQTHVAVADALHALSPPPRARPLVFGPTLAYPAYQVNNFSLFDEVMGAFIREAGPHVDGISVHLYDTYDEEVELPSPRSGSNLDAILDMQETYSLAMTGRVLPALVSEHGSGFKRQPLRYEPLHDWYVIRGVNAQVLQLMARPDRLLKSVPFIVGKATWDSNTKTNATFSYPWVLWRFNQTTELWDETYLHLFYRLWSGFDGQRVATTSSDANVLVAAVRSPGSLRVAVHNLRAVTSSVQLDWQGLAGSVGSGRIARLGLDTATQTPVLSNSSLAPGSRPPSALVLQPSETVVIEVSGAAPDSPPQKTDDRSVFHSTVVLQSLERPVTTPFPSAGCTGPAVATGGELRLSIGGDADAFRAAMPLLQVRLNGVAVVVDPASAIGGSSLHVNAQDNSALAALRLPLPAASLSGLPSATVTTSLPGQSGDGLVLAAAVLEVDCVAP